MSGEKMSDKFKFVSEKVEPTFAYIIGGLYAKCEYEKEHGDKWSLESACVNFWYGVQAINKMTIAMGDCSHANVSIMNEIRVVSNYIKDTIGIDPILDDCPIFKFRN